MHFARLIKQASVDLVSRPICLFGAYIYEMCRDNWSIPANDFEALLQHITLLYSFKL